MTSPSTHEPTTLPPAKLPATPPSIWPSTMPARAAAAPSSCPVDPPPQHSSWNTGRPVLVVALPGPPITATRIHNPDANRVPIEVVLLVTADRDRNTATIADSRS